MSHIHYIDSQDSPHRLVIELNESKTPAMPYGAIEWVYDPESSESDFLSNQLEEIQPFVRNGLLVLQDVYEAGTIITIALRAGYVLDDIVLDEVHSLVELVNESGMLYWIQVGRTGAFSLKAKMIEDSKGGQNKIAKLRANLKDIPLREYLAKQAIVQIQPQLLKHSDYPDVVDIHLAAQYLGIKESTLQKFHLKTSHGPSTRISAGRIWKSIWKRR